MNRKIDKVQTKASAESVLALVVYDYSVFESYPALSIRKKWRLLQEIDFLKHK